MTFKDLAQQSAKLSNSYAGEFRLPLLSPLFVASSHPPSLPAPSSLRPPSPLQVPPSGVAGRPIPSSTSSSLTLSRSIATDFSSLLHQIAKENGKGPKTRTKRKLLRDIVKMKGKEPSKVRRLEVVVVERHQGRRKTSYERRVDLDL